MKGKRHLNLIHLTGLIFIIWLFYTSIFPQAGIIAEAGDSKSFEATLTVRRTGCNKGEDNISRITIGFTDNENATIIPSPPNPPVYCIHASIDPENTKSDYKYISNNTGQQGWERVILPIPGESALWGLIVRYKDNNTIYSDTNGYNDPNNTVTLMLTWDPNRLTDGLFLLTCRPEYDKVIHVDMHDRSFIELPYQKIVLDEEKIIPMEIRYYPYEPNSILGIICVGGEDKELQYYGGLRPAFSHLGYKTAQYLRKKMASYHRDNIYFIPFFHPISDIDSDDENDHFNISDLEIRQKDRLKSAISDWVPKKWAVRNPVKPVLLIYLIDHGYSDGTISIDPNLPDFNKGNFSGEELREWLLDLKDILESPEINIYNYEIIILVEACYSGSFLNKLKPLDENWIAISSTDNKNEAIISGIGENTFSRYFWENIITLGYDIWEAFEFAKEKNPQILVQNPQFFPDPEELPESKCKEDENTLPLKKRFLIDCIPWAGKKELPDIESIKIREDEDSEFLDPNDIKPFAYNRLLFTVTISNTDYSLTNAWIDIIYTGPDGKSELFTSDQAESNCSEDTCTFSPDYCFFYPGDYEFWVRVRGGEDNEISTPFPFYFKIPGISDVHEPNDTMQQAKPLDIDIPQEHYLIDNTDIDWIKVPIYKICYEVHIIPENEYLSDPNLYNVRAFKVKDVLEEIPLKWASYNDYGEIILYTQPPIDWRDEEPCMVYLRISSGIDSKKPLPYKIQITKMAAVGVVFYYVEMDKAIKECLDIENIDNNLSGQNNIYIKSSCQDSSLNTTMLWIDDNIANTSILSVRITAEHNNLNSCSYDLYIRDVYIMTLNENKFGDIFRPEEDSPLSRTKDFDNDGYTNADECFMRTDPLVFTDVNFPFDPNFFIIPLSTDWNLISFQVDKCYYEGDYPTVFIPEGVEMVKLASLLEWLNNTNASPVRDADNPALVRGDWRRFTSFDSDGAHILDTELPPNINTLKYLSAGYGYWIKMNKPGMLILEGGYIPDDTRLELSKGWNLTGYIPHGKSYGSIDKGSICPYITNKIIYTPAEKITYCRSDEFIPFIFKNIKDAYRRIISFDTCTGAMFYDTDVPDSVITLHYIGPKYGYWIKMLENRELIYPNGCL